jgi:protein TonB
MSPAARLTLAAALAACLTACQPPQPQPASAPDAGMAATPAPAPAPITDEAGLRAAASKALAEQRFYAPAGGSAIDHYLALRALRPDDANLATALLELLPYAVIGSEQAVARQDLEEARRLLGLVERVDAQAPSLPRLRDTIARAGAEATARQAAAADAQARALAQREDQARLAAIAAAQPPAAAVTQAAPPPAAPATALPVVPLPVATAPAAPASPPPPVAAAPAAPRPAQATAVPRLLSAPSPRYPLMAMRRKLEGEVTVQFTIQPDGSVAAPRVVSSTPPGVFDEAALVAASRWRFESGASAVASTRVVQFRLDASQR